MSQGLIVGKFYPLHAGHSMLIDHALEVCDRVTVMLLANSAESIPVGVRHQWIAERHPQAHVVSGTADHPIDYDDRQVWELWEREIRQLLDTPVDVVFSSEEYGDELARRLGARSEVVDIARRQVPVSGTAIRQDPAAHWQYLSPAVRAWFVHRIAIVGAESSGTTTLARTLADHYGAKWVPEYGREYTVAKIANEGPEAAWRSDEFVSIARRQLEIEDDAARASNVPVLFCDTDAFATAIWHERYMGHESNEVWRLADPSRYRIYLVTDHNIPFEQDGYRDGEHLRGWMTQRFVEELERRRVPYVYISGTPTERREAARVIIDEIVDAGWSFVEPHVPSIRSVEEAPDGGR